MRRRNPPPGNLEVVWHRGTNSFGQVLLDGRKVYKEYYAPEGKQLSEADFHVLYQTALGLAKMNPAIIVQFTRYDLESKVPENLNNRNYRLTLLSKMMNVFGDIYFGYINGKIKL